MEMGLHVTLLKILKVHECQTKKTKGLRRICRVGKYVYNKFPTNLDDEVITYKKFACQCEKTTIDNVTEIVFRPNVGVTSFSDQAYFGELFDCKIINQFRFGPYSETKDLVKFGFSDCSGTYSGQMLENVCKQLENEPNVSYRMENYRFLCSLIDDFSTFIIVHK
jgi:hypothetical protein